MSKFNEEATNKLISAADQFNFEEMKEALDAGANIDVQDENGMTLLMRLSPNLEMVEFLLKNKANTEIKNNYGSNVLHMLLSYDNNFENYIKILEAITKSGINLEAKDNMGYTPLRLAIASDNIEATKLLMEYEVRLDQIFEDSNQTPIIYAAINKKTEALKIIAQYDENLDFQGHNGTTALMSAALVGHKEGIEILVGKDANLDLQDDQGSTALIYALDSTHYDTAIALIEANADFNIQNNYQHTALTIARRAGEPAQKVVDAIEWYSDPYKCMASFKGEDHFNLPVVGDEEAENPQGE